MVSQTKLAIEEFDYAGGEGYFGGVIRTSTQPARLCVETYG
jgi:hypothetical protein